MAWKFTTRRALGLNAVCAVMVWLGVTWVSLDRLANQYRHEAGEHRLTAIRLLLKASELDLPFHQGGSRDFDLEDQSEALRRATQMSPSPHDFGTSQFTMLAIDVAMAAYVGTVARGVARKLGNQLKAKQPPSGRIQLIWFR